MLLALVYISAGGIDGDGDAFAGRDRPGGPRAVLGRDGVRLLALVLPGQLFARADARALGQEGVFVARVTDELEPGVGHHRRDDDLVRRHDAPAEARPFRRHRRRLAFADLAAPLEGPHAGRRHDRDVLRAARLVAGDGMVDVRAGLERPDALAGLRVDRFKQAVGVAVEQKPAGRGQKAAAVLLGAVGHVLFPVDLVGGSVEGGEQPFVFDARNGRVGEEVLGVLGPLQPARPDRAGGVELMAFRIVGHRRGAGGEDGVHAVGHVHVHRLVDAQADEAFRDQPLGHAVGTHVPRIDRERLGRRGMQARVLRHRALLHRPDRLAGRAVEQEHVAVGADGREALAHLAVDFGVVKNERRAEIGFPDVVMDDLVMPFQLTGLDVERDDGVGKEIVACAQLAAELRNGIADAEVCEAQLRIDRRGHPHAAAARLPVLVILRPGLVTFMALVGNDVEGPLLLAGLGVQPDDAPAQPEVAVRHAGNEHAVRVGRRRGDLLALDGRIVADAPDPEQIARGFVERGDARTGHGREHLAVPDGHALRAHRALFGLVGPEELAGFGIERAHALAGGDEHPSARDDGRAARVLAVEGVKPRAAELAHVALVDFIQGGEAGVGVIAARDRPFASRGRGRVAGGVRHLAAAGQHGRDREQTGQHDPLGQVCTERARKTGAHAPSSKG